MAFAKSINHVTVIIKHKDQYLIGKESRYDFSFGSKEYKVSFNKSLSGLKDEIKEIFEFTDFSDFPIISDYEKFTEDMKLKIQDWFLIKDPNPDHHYVLDKDSFQRRFLIPTSNYGFPKGGIEEGESSDQAAIRELKEEIFYDFSGKLTKKDTIKWKEKISDLYFYEINDESEASEIIKNYNLNQRKSELFNVNFCKINEDILKKLNKISKNAYDKIIVPIKETITASSTDAILYRVPQNTEKFIMPKSYERKPISFNKKTNIEDKNWRFNQKYNENSYLQKYLKYKAKYLALKKQLQ